MGADAGSGLRRAGLRLGTHVRHRNPRRSDRRWVHDCRMDLGGDVTPKDRRGIDHSFGFTATPGIRKTLPPAALSWRAKRIEADDKPLLVRVVVEEIRGQGWRWRMTRYGLVHDDLGHGECLSKLEALAAAERAFAGLRR